MTTLSRQDLFDAIQHYLAERDAARALVRELVAHLRWRAIVGAHASARETHELLTRIDALDWAREAR